MTSGENERKKYQSSTISEHQEDKNHSNRRNNNFNIDDEDIEIIKDFSYLGSIINSNGDCRQEFKRKLRLGRVVMEELGKIIESKDVPSETKVKVIHIFVFQGTMFGCESWIVKNI